MSDEYNRGRADEKVDARITDVEARHQQNLERFRLYAEELAGLKAKHEEMDKKLDTIIEMITLLRGGFRLLLWLGGVSAAIGAMIHSFFGQAK